MIRGVDIEKLKYYTPEKINTFFIGVEGNNYLILSVIQQNYELFKFLITEKNAKVDYVNGNGWTILFFIVTKKLWNYFSFLLLKLSITFKACPKYVKSPLFSIKFIFS